MPATAESSSHRVWSFLGLSKLWRAAVNIELLRRTFTPESINPLWLHAIRNEGKSSCACPSCKNPMIEVALSDQDVNVDVCRPCHFIWFDVREVENLVPRPVPPAPPEVPQKVREIIAIERVKQLAEEARGPDFDSVARRTKGGNGSPRSLECRSNLMPCRRSGAHGQRGYLAQRLSPSVPFAFTRLHEIVSAIWSNSRASDASARPHFSDLVFPSCRGDSSHRQHVLPPRVWR